ncbi:MAG: acyl-CoA dehydrogenase family protein [Deltaproteobacteria bacterium]|nr:acyl-CoA dehydrogenase family protein [Deltaproteobacteria bacterium]
MRFETTKQQKNMRDDVRGFIERYSQRDYQRELDKKELFPHDLWDKLADMGPSVLVSMKNTGDPAVI